jgi:spermidine synthase
LITQAIDAARVAAKSHRTCGDAVAASSGIVTASASQSDRTSSAPASRCSPHRSTGWWSCTLAKKSGGFDFRDADARAKAFASKYYSADIHKGASTLPPFVAEALGE